MSRAFSKRTLAIAVAAGVALGGVQAVAPAAVNPVALPAAVAADETHITNADVTLSRFYDAKGDIPGAVRRAGAVTAESGYRELAADAKLEFKINVANAKAGDVVTITPQTSYTLPDTGDKIHTSTGIGIYLTTTQNNVPLEIGGSQVAQLSSRSSGSATIKFDEAVEDLVNGELTVTLPAGIFAYYAGDAGVGNSAEYTRFPAEWAAVVKTTGSGDEVARLGERKIETIRIVESPYLPRLDVYSSLSESPIEGDTVRLRRLDQRLPFSKDVKVVLSPKTDGDKVDWTFNGTATPQVILWEFPDGDQQDSKISRVIEKPEDVEAAGVTFDHDYDQNGNLVVTIHGIAGTIYKPVVRLINEDFGTADYSNGGEFYVNANITEIDANDHAIVPSYDKENRFLTLPTLADKAGAGEAKNPAFEATLGTIKDEAIQGKPVTAEPEGVSDPARIAGKKRTFVFDVKNTGNVTIKTINVALPNGETKEVPVDNFTPGAEQQIEVDLEVDANATELPFALTLGSKGQPTKFNFKVDQSTNAVKNPDGTFTITDPLGNSIIVVSQDELGRVREELGRVEDRVTKLEGYEDVYVVKGVRNGDNSITLTLNNGDVITIPAASKKGLERCMSGTGGVILALLPVLGLLGAGLSQVKLPGIGEQMEQIQRQAGIYNEDLARFVADNGPAIGTTIGALAAALLFFVPGTCGDMSLAGAIGEAGSGSSAKPAADATPAQ